jgi:hypothetical protein
LSPGDGDEAHREEATWFHDGTVFYVIDAGGEDNSRAVLYLGGKKGHVWEWNVIRASQNGVPAWR